MANLAAITQLFTSCWRFYKSDSALSVALSSSPSINHGRNWCKLVALWKLRRRKKKSSGARPQFTAN